MSPSEWAVLAGAGASIALVNWYFFVAGRSVTSAVTVPASARSSAATAASSAPLAVADVVIVVDDRRPPEAERR